MNHSRPMLLALALSLLTPCASRLAADPPAASQPASQPAPTVSMWQLLHAGVVNGQLLLVPANKDPVDIREITTMANVPGSVHVHTYLREVQAYTYRVLTDGTKKRTQTALLQDSDFRLTDLVRDSATDEIDSVFYHDIFAAKPATRVSLLVTRTDKTVDGVKQPQKTLLKLNAPTFGQLCAQHPDEVQKYLEPILHDLDLGGVFFIDLQDAQHAFASQLQPDPAVVAKLQALLPRLDDDSPDTRLAAEAELKSLGDSGLAPVRAIDLSKQPVQTQITLKTFLTNTASAEDPRLATPDFLLLCLTLDDKQIPALAKAKLEKIRGKPLDFDLAAPAADRRKAVRKILIETWSADQQK